MTIELLALLGTVIFFVWIYVPVKNRLKSMKQKMEDIALYSRKDNLKTEVDPNESLTQSIKSFREDMKKSLAQYREQNRNDVAVAESKIERANQFVKNTGLDETALYLKERIHSNDLDISVETKRKESDLGSRNIELIFTYKEHCYKLGFETNSSWVNDGDDGELTLSMDDNVVLSLRYEECGFDNPYGTSWAYEYVKAIEIGDWIGEIVEIEEKMRLSEERKHIESRMTSTSETAGKIKGV